MSRRFRIDASQKIQASPVDFGRFEGMSRTTKEQIAGVLEEHRTSLEEYFQVKVGGIVKQLNADIRNIINNYVDIDDPYEVSAFLYILCGKQAGIWDTSKDSSVLDNLKYIVESDPSYIWVQIHYDNSVIDEADHEDDLFYAPSISCAIFLDYDNEDETIEHLDITKCNSDGFIEALSMALTLKPYIGQVTPGTVVNIAESIIYEFAEFVDEEFSRILESATEQFLEGN
jgi:hypothetical protein